MELIMNGITVLCLMTLIFLKILEITDKKEKPIEKREESRAEELQNELTKLMEYSEQDAINSKKR